jgi:Xaa-Pro aminopeptidase
LPEFQQPENPPGVFGLCKRLLSREHGWVKLPRLIIAASEHDADLLHATGFHAPDAFLFLEKDGHRSVVLSPLEVDRGRREARVDEVIALSDIEASLRGKSRKPVSYAKVIAAYLRSRKALSVQVPASFPLGLAHQLESEGVRLRPVDGLFFPERELKGADDIRAMQAATRLTEAAMQRGFDVLKGSRIRKDGVLLFGNSVLTAERLRTEVETVILQGGGTALNHSIIAGGEQACDPHERGHGPLRANELIILDIFPRIAKTGFYGDLTRTVVRGRATDAQKRIWETCLKGQKRALKALQPGVVGATLQDEIRAFFSKEGYPTEQREGRWSGFFHGLGHGLGLELHEEPRLGRTTLRPGQVFTVEPGIYVPGVGGVRHEDVVVITETGSKLLSKIAKPLEI